MRATADMNSTMWIEARPAPPVTTRAITAPARLMIMTAVALLGLFGVSGSADAASVFISNPGFEADFVIEGAWITGLPTGWTSLTGSGGTFNPHDLTHITGGAAEGLNTHWGNGSTLSQVLGETLTVWTEYTLRVEVGDRLDTSFPGYRVQFGVNDGGLFVLLAEDVSSLTPSDGFLTSTVAYTAVAGHPNLGDPVEIRLVSLGAQINFDDVRLDTAAVPPTPAIYIENAGFEAIVLAEGGYTSTAPPGWTNVAGSGGTFNPDDTLHFPGGAPEGANTHYGSGSVFSQILGVTLSAPFDYTLTVQVGDRLDLPFPDYAVQLGVNDGGAFVLLAEDNNSLTPSGGFLTSTVTYSATVADVNLGDFLEIRLVSSGSQVNFDDVSLTAEEVIVGGPSDQHFLVIKPIAPAGSMVGMWGYGRSSGAVTDCDLDTTEVTAPGPLLRVPPGSDLEINLYNCLDVPTSIVVPGLPMPGGAPPGSSPVWTDGTSGPRGGDLTRRMRSFTHEAPPRSGTTPGTATYTWMNPGPGTHLYHSGTHAAVQVQMGLYGALTKDFAMDEAYDEARSAPLGGGYAIDPTYDEDIIVLYGEVERDLHEAVTGGTYGTPPGPTSTIDYEPDHQLVHTYDGSGNPAPFAGLPLTAGQRLLVRFVNAGLETHVPALQGEQGLYMDVIAEDGHLYPFPREQYSVLLPAGKSADAIITPAAGGTYQLLDRMLYTSAQPAPGEENCFDGLDDDGDTLIDCADPDCEGAAGGLCSTGLPGICGAGTRTCSAGSEICAAPDPSTEGPAGDPSCDDGLDNDCDGVGDAADPDCLPVNTAPVAMSDSLTTPAENSLAISLMATDTDGNPLIYIVNAAPLNGSLTGAPPDLTYTPDVGFSGVDSFGFIALDGTAVSNVGTITITVLAPGLGVLDFAATTPEDTPTAPPLALLGTAPWRIVTPAAHGTLSGVLGDGTIPTGVVVYTPEADYNGGDSFIYEAQGGAPGIGTVSITITPVNDPPEAVADVGTVPLNLAIVIDVVANDLDIDGDTLLFVAVSTPPASGSVVCSGAGICTYTPAALGTYGFMYQVFDGAAVATGTVTITVVGPTMGALFVDDFNRPAGPIVGNGWQEVETTENEVQVGPPQ